MQGAAHSDSGGSVSGSVVAEHPDTSAVQGGDVNCALAAVEVGDGGRAVLQHVSRNKQGVRQRRYQRSKAAWKPMEQHGLVGSTRGEQWTVL